MSPNVNKTLKVNPASFWISSPWISEGVCRKLSFQGPKTQKKLRFKSSRARVDEPTVLCCWQLLKSSWWKSFRGTKMTISGWLCVKRVRAQLQTLSSAAACWVSAGILSSQQEKPLEKRIWRRRVCGRGRPTPLGAEMSQTHEEPALDFDLWPPEADAVRIINPIRPCWVVVVCSCSPRAAASLPLRQHIVRGSGSVTAAASHWRVEVSFEISAGGQILVLLNNSWIMIINSELLYWLN